MNTMQLLLKFTTILDIFKYGRCLLILFSDILACMKCNWHHVWDCLKKIVLKKVGLHNKCVMVKIQLNFKCEINQCLTISLFISSAVALDESQQLFVQVPVDESLVFDMNKGRHDIELFHVCRHFVSMDSLPMELNPLNKI